MFMSDEPNQAIVSLDKLEKISRIAAAIAIPVVIAIGGWLLQVHSESGKLNQEYVKIAVEILRADSDTQNVALREWAVDLIDKHSEVSLSTPARKALISGEAGLPPTTPSARTPGNYDLGLPDGIDGVPHIQKEILESALDEINRNVHERKQPEAIRKYWQVLGQDLDGFSSKDWSAAFLSWVVAATGNPSHLLLADTESAIWNDAVKRGFTFTIKEQEPTPGDLAFFKRRHQSDAGNPSDFAGHSGVVYEVFGDGFTMIAGNSADMIRLTRVYYDRKTAMELLGFVRIHQ